MALRFTADGAVGAPTSLQIRIASGRPGPVRIGAPVPSRALAVGEVLSNARHFREPGPRSAPIEHVVLSGVPDAWFEQTVAQVVPALGHLGLVRVVVHLDETQVRSGMPIPAGCDPSVTSTDPGTLGSGSPGLGLTVPLVDEVLANLDAVMTGAERLQPRHVTWLWPFPDGTAARPAPASVVAESLARSIGRWEDAPFAWGIKGLPRCALDRLESVVRVGDRIWRTRNRYYVDADHQHGAALMFEPDLVRLVKSDRCRFCAVDDRCDGVPERWLAEGLAPDPSPLETP